jgi:putative peptidoglycan lipid II flippase
VPRVARPRAGVSPSAGRAGLAGLAGVAGGIAVLTVVARVAGFGRTAVLAGVAGRTCVADAYLTANQIPNVVFEVVAGGALAAAVLPLVTGSAARSGGPASPTAPAGATDPEIARTLSALLGWVLATLIPAAVGCAVLAPVLARALTGTGCPGEATLVSRMIVVFAAQIPLYGLSVLAAGTLQAAHRFTAAAAAPLVSTVVVTAGYLLFAVLLPAGGVPTPDRLPRSALLAIAGGTTAGVLALALTVVLAATRLPGVAAIRPTLRFPAGRGALAVRLAGAGLVAVLAAQGAAVVVTVVANRFGAVGSLASYSYASAVYLLPAAVLTMPVTTSVLPRVAAAGVRSAAPATRLVVGSSTVVVVLALAGAAVLVAVAPAAGRLFDAGPGGGAAAGVGSVLSWLAPGVPGAALGTHLGRLASALRRPSLAGVVGAAGWILAAVAAIVAGQVASAARLPAALGAATAAGMLGGGLLAVAVWSRARGLPGLGPLAGPTVLGLAAAVAGAALGRRADRALLPAAGVGGRDLGVLFAAAVAGVTALAVVGVVVGAGARLTGLHRRLGGTG